MKVQSSYLYLKIVWTECESSGYQTRRYLLCRFKTGHRLRADEYCARRSGRPVLVIQNDIGNKHSPTVICAAITSKMNKAKLPTHVELNTRRCAMVRDSVILLEQLRTIDKQRLKEKICHIDGALLQEVDRALKVSLELDT